jgi:hypothetical protein
MKHDIFISYRREGGKEIARIIKSYLDAQGFKVFLDFDELKDGVFDDRLIDAIKESKVFMFILSPKSLDRCVNEGDWVRKEIEHAVSLGKHIIPVNPDGLFKNFPEGLPEPVMEALGRNQHSEVMTGQLFQASMKKMIDERVKPFTRKKRSAAKYLLILPVVAAIAAVFMINRSLSAKSHVESDIANYEAILKHADEMMHFEDSLDMADVLIDSAAVISGRYTGSEYTARFGHKVEDAHVHCQAVRDSLLNEYRPQFEKFVNKYIVSGKKADKTEARRIGEKILSLKNDVNVRNIMETILI